LGIKTKGVYNPFILPALQRAGYIRSALPGYENNPQDNYQNRSVVNVEQLEIGDYWATIPYGTAIDLGGCGKGYLADQLAEEIMNYSIYGYWLSLDGDIATYGYDENGNNLTLSIQSANNINDVSDWMIRCPSKQSGVATSGVFSRKNQKESKEWHHIIDPITLKPARTDIRLATVCANNVIDADVLASCAIIFGSDKAERFLSHCGAKAWLLQCVDDKGVSFEKKYGSFIKERLAIHDNMAVQNA